MNAEPGWRRLRVARLNCETRKSRPPTSARISPLRGSMATRAACRLRVGETPRDHPYRSFRCILELGDEGCLHLPVRRVVAAEDLPELLAQELLRVARRVDPSPGDTAQCGYAWRGASRSCASVMNPSSRIRASTTWLRSSAPGRLVHGRQAGGRSRQPRDQAHTPRRFRLFAGRPNRCRDIVSTP